MIKPAFFIGEPLIFDNIKIYPPKVKEVVAGIDFNVFYRLLSMTQEDINDEVKEKIPEGKNLPSPFEFLMAHCQYIEGYEPLVCAAFNFFCRVIPIFNYEDNLIILGNTILSEANYFDFQNVIRESIGDKPVSPYVPPDPDEDPRITRIKELAKQREKIKAKQNAKSGISLTTTLTAICCMGIGITPLNIGEMSYAAIGPIMRMSQEREKYDIDIRSLLAGADSKKIKPKYWIRNSDKD